jgi:F0F1-type ATP synthase assembly protein I
LNKTPLQAIVIVSSLGIQFAVSLSIGFIVGNYLDDRFHTDQLFMIIGILVGIGAGIMGAARLIKPFLIEDE